jgi:hypothetical protein
MSKRVQESISSNRNLRLLCPSLYPFRDLSVSAGKGSLLEPRKMYRYILRRNPADLSSPRVPLPVPTLRREVGSTRSENSFPHRAPLGAFPRATSARALNPRDPVVPDIYQAGLINRATRRESRASSTTRIINPPLSPPRETEAR